MTDQEIRDAIAADPTLAALAASRADDGAIAAALSSGTEVVSRLTSERGLLEFYPDGPVAADAVMTKLETFANAGQSLSSVVKRALKFLAMPEGLDLGSSATRGMLDMLAAGGVITADEATKIKSVAQRTKVITAQQVAKALEGQ